MADLGFGEVELVSSFSVSMSGEIANAVSLALVAGRHQFVIRQ